MGDIYKCDPNKACSTLDEDPPQHDTITGILTFAGNQSSDSVRLVQHGIRSAPNIDNIDIGSAISAAKAYIADIDAEITYLNTIRNNWQQRVAKLKAGAVPEEVVSAWADSEADHSDRIAGGVTRDTIMDALKIFVKTDDMHGQHLEPDVVIMSRITVLEIAKISHNAIDLRESPMQEPFQFLGMSAYIREDVNNRFDDNSTCLRLISSQFDRVTDIEFF